MTSKEALEKLKEISTTTYSDEWLSIIEKDLDILQIIREHFQVCFDSDSDNGLDTVVFNGFPLIGFGRAVMTMNLRKLNLGLKKENEK